MLSGLMLVSSIQAIGPSAQNSMKAMTMPCPIRLTSRLRRFGMGSADVLAAAALTNGALICQPPPGSAAILAASFSRGGQDGRAPRISLPVLRAARLVDLGALHLPHEEDAEREHDDEDDVRDGR